MLPCFLRALKLQSSMLTFEHYICCYRGLILLFLDLRLSALLSPCVHTTDPRWIVPKKGHSDSDLVVKSYDMHGITFTFKESGLVGMFSWPILISVRLHHFHGCMNGVPQFVWWMAT